MLLAVDSMSILEMQSGNLSDEPLRQHLAATFFLWKHEAATSVVSRTAAHEAATSVVSHNAGACNFLSGKLSGEPHCSTRSGNLSGEPHCSTRSGNLSGEPQCRSMQFSERQTQW